MVVIAFATEFACGRALFAASLLGRASAIAASAGLFLVCMAPASAQGSPPIFAPNIAVPRITRAPEINGDLSGAVWKQAAKVLLGYNLRSHAQAEEQTTTYIMTDGTFLYVGFDARQMRSIQATQHTNDVGFGTDDQVAVYLWPDAGDGFSYAFYSNPIGTRYQFSTENTAYAPTWWSAGRIQSDGYTVTMKIPLAVIRGGTAKPWRVQFARQNPHTLDDFVWAFGSAEQQGAEQDVRYSGYLSGMPVRQAATRPRPRVEVYGLGDLAARTIGGPTSRAGVDLSIPITPTASFIATIHPDYSNVELDQQTIAPTAYRRLYSEVRPFFTQGANFYNGVVSTAGPAIQELYTPSIPTPRDGYALEGTQGQLNFATFDAVGNGRTDSAQALTVHTADLKYNFTMNRIAVNMPGFKDDTAVYGLSHDSNKGLLEYVNYGEENGTLVTDPTQATRFDIGLGAYDKSTLFGVALRRAGTQYDPFDGYVQHPGIAGWSADASKTWYLNSKARIPRVVFAGSIDAYRDTVSGIPNQADTQLALGWDMQNILGTKKLWHAYISTGSSYLRLPNGVFAPINQNGAWLAYNYRTETPSYLYYYTGRFGVGRLDSWTRITNWKIGGRALLTLEADDTIHRLDSGARNVQWLERASIAYQSGPNASLAIGVRRIIGTAPELYGPSPFQSAWNVSLAYHQRLPHDELYFVYGDASAFSTVPQLILKVIHYFGAEKGT